MKCFLTICLVIFIAVLSVVSLSNLWEGFILNSAEAFVGQACPGGVADCFQPSTCHKGFCTGACVSDPVCQTLTFLNNMGWENGVCAGDSTNPGVCVEASLKKIPTGPQTGAALLHLVETVTDWVFAGFLVLATIFIIAAAFQFVTKGGEPAQVSQARMKLLWAVVAIAIAAAAKGVPVVVRHIVGL